MPCFMPGAIRACASSVSKKGPLTRMPLARKTSRSNFRWCPVFSAGPSKSGMTASQVRRTRRQACTMPCAVPRQKATPSSLSVRGFRPVVSVSKHQESCFSSSATMAERASSVSAMMYSCLKSSTVFRWRSSNKIPLAGTVLPRVRRRGGGSLRRELFRLGRSKQIVRREGGLPGFRRFFSRTAWPCMERNSSS